MDTDALLKALEDAEADMGGGIKNTARRHKESTMGVNTSEVEEPKLYPELETLETAGAVKELTNGQKLEIAGVSVYKWDGLVIDLNTARSILRSTPRGQAKAFVLSMGLPCGLCTVPLGIWKKSMPALCWRICLKLLLELQ